MIVIMLAHHSQLLTRMEQVPAVKLKLPTNLAGHSQTKSSNFRKVQETERYRSNTSLNIGTNNQQNDVFELNVEGTVLAINSSSRRKWIYIIS